jgi:hypothetical protein
MKTNTSFKINDLPTITAVIVAKLLIYKGMA